MLCQVLPPSLRVPETGSPVVWTVTLVTLPLRAATLMPAAGSTSWLPFDGVIFSSAASIAARALADAAACALAWAGLRPDDCPALLLHAVASRPMAAVAAMMANPPRLANLPSAPRTGDPPLASGTGDAPLAYTDA